METPTPPAPQAGKSYSTDEILDVYEHLMKNEQSWGECLAGHGLDPIAVNRALKVMFGEGNGRAKIAIQAFNLGLQFGAMRLDPIEYDASAEPPCNCLFCQMRRAAESEGGGV